MRIVTRERDYYDGVQFAGADHSLVFVRIEREETKFIPVRVALGRRVDLQKSGYLSAGESVIVGFAGKVYAGIELELWTSVPKFDKVSQREFTGFDITSKMCFSVEDMDAFIAEHKLEAIGWRGQSWHADPLMDTWLHRRFYAAYFQAMVAERDRYTDVFLEYKTPVFVYERNVDLRFNVLTVNATLSGYEFQRVFPPYQAYQELQMYLAGLASPEQEHDQVSDDIRYEYHGFNKESFRSVSPGKKERRRAKALARKQKKA